MVSRNRKGFSRLLNRKAISSKVKLLHAERASSQFGVSIREILVEDGGARPWGGQEDLARLSV